MTTEFDTIKAHLDAAKVSSDANNAKLAELIALTDGLKTKLDAAIAAGAAMTAAEVQALSDQIVQLATSDDAAKAAAEAAILAHTPAA